MDASLPNTPAMNTRKRIALAFSIGLPRHERLIDGVARYARDRELEWSFVVAPEHPVCTIGDLTEWHGDGVIASLDTPVDSRLASTFHIPIVDISGSFETSPAMRVLVDNRAVGQLAADHLMARGFRRFGYYGLEDLRYSEQRLEGFRERLAEHGFETEALRVPATFRLKNIEWKTLYNNLETWLKRLDYPLGLFIVSDDRARVALDLCHDLKIPVPSRAAVISVDNEATICEQSRPTLSSIDKNEFEIGQRVAEMLDDMMSGRKCHAGDVILGPRGVVARGSTATLSVEDERLSRAIDFIRANYHRPITVSWVALHIDASRRWLENAFREHTRVSPYRFLCDYRIDKARQLLEGDEKLSIARVAELSGFDNAKHFNSVFKRVVGESPTRYRRGVMDRGLPD